MRSPSVRRTNSWLLSAAFFAVAGTSFAWEPASLSGQLSGRVTDSAGTPQMGAAIQLYNQFDRQVAKALTNERGAFQFAGLPAGDYSVRVSLASFLPVLKRRISVNVGAQSFLAVNLASLFSSIELVYFTPGRTPVMSEDWVWVLRGAGATRPVLRLTPRVASNSRHRAVFAHTSGVLKVSAGEGGSVSAVGNQADLGTAFALATSLFGDHKLELSGNLGYASNIGLPTAGFRTTYTPGGDGATRVNVTVRQVALGARAGLALLLGDGSNGAPPLRTYEANFTDARQIADDLLFEYGSTLESVSFMRRLNYVSPYARLSWGSLEGGLIQAAYSSGAPALPLMTSDAEAATGDSLSSLALFPRVSLVNGDATVQRTENFEVAYRRRVGSREFSASAYSETMNNTAALLSGAEGFYSAADLLPDLASRSYVFNVGQLRRNGYTVMLTQELGEVLQLSAGLTYTDGLSAGDGSLRSNDPGELRSGLRNARRHGVLARVTGLAPVAGTRYVVGYQWTDYSVFQPIHFSLVQQASFDPGLNVGIRQPLPVVSGMFPGRVEANAELRNLLAQGYVSLAASDGRPVLLIHSPRAVRGGLSFIF